MRWVVRIIFGVLVLAVVAAGLVFLLPAQKVATYAAAQMLRSTGRVLNVEGPVRPSLWPVLGVKTGPVTLSNAAWSKEGPMLRAKGLSIGVDPAALFGGTVRITDLAFEAPEILLERASDGQANWELAGTEVAPAAASGGSADPGRTISLDRATVRDGRLRYVDHRPGGMTLDVSGIEAEAAVPDFAGPATVQMTGTVAGKALTADLRVDRAAPFLSGGVEGATLKATLGASTVAFEGRAGLSPVAAEGDLALDLADLDGVMALAGLPAPALPQGFGAQVRTLSGRVTLAPDGSAHLRGGTLTLDGNRVTGDADLTLSGERPKITARLVGGALDFTAGKAAPAPAVGPAPSSPAKGWPETPIDVSALALFDADLALKAGSVDLGFLTLGASDLRLTLDRSRAVVESRGIAAYGGTLAGNVVVNGRGGLSVGGDLTLSGVDMRTALERLAGFDRPAATGDVRLKVLGSGASVAAIMGSLSGSGSLAVGQGELRGLDLVGMLRTLDVSYVGKGARTIFDAITGSFSIAGGVLRNDDLLLRAPYVTAAGAGTVDLGKRSLSYRIEPTALVKEDGSGGIRVPLIVSGPWSDLAYRIDLKALADQELAGQKDALKAKAAERLGIRPEEGEGFNDAAKRRAKDAAVDEAGRALRKLLGKN